MEVLSIGSTTGNRQSDHILPYLPKFRNRFGGLPTIAEEITLKAMSIPLGDVECITKTIVKVKGPAWYLRTRKGIINTSFRSILPEY